MADYDVSFGAALFQGVAGGGVMRSPNGMHGVGRYAMTGMAKFKPSSSEMQMTDAFTLIASSLSLMTLAGASVLAATSMATKELKGGRVAFGATGDDGGPYGSSG